MEPGGMEVDLGMGGESFGCLQMGVVTLLHNVIITGDEQRKTWFAQYLKCMQQKVCRLARGLLPPLVLQEHMMTSSLLWRTS